MLNTTVGKHVTFKLVFVDTNGNPMLVTPTVDAPPVWTNTALDHFTAAPDGLTCQADAVGPGSDMITVKLNIGGKQYVAQLAAVVS